ncbi:hypothetical protein L1887_63082 [Cichorium endivia]|nr:hypothetical protein L1887_63082 [Cichorium endivia]
MNSAANSLSPAQASSAQIRDLGVAVGVAEKSGEGALEILGQARIPPKHPSGRAAGAAAAAAAPCFR